MQGKCTVLLGNKNFKQQSYRVGKDKNTTWKLVREGREAGRADGDTAARKEGEKQEWFPEGGRAICSEMQLSICVRWRRKTTHWVLATGGSLATMVRAVSRCGGHRGQNGREARNRHGKGRRPVKQVRRRKKSIREWARRSGVWRKILLLRYQRPEKVSVGRRAGPEGRGWRDSRRRMDHIRREVPRGWEVREKLSQICWTSRLQPISDWSWKGCGGSRAGC